MNVLGPDFDPRPLLVLLSPGASSARPLQPSQNVFLREFVLVRIVSPAADDVPPQSLGLSSPPHCWAAQHARSADWEVA